MTVIGYTSGLLWTGVSRLPQQRTFGLFCRNEIRHIVRLFPSYVLEHGQ